MKFSILTRSVVKHRYVKSFQSFSSFNIRPEEKSCEKSYNLEGAYDPKNVETEDKYLGWCEKERYSVDYLEENCKGIVLPPPNITGKLHLGHALSGTIQDVIARMWRMKNKQVSWIPGTDHAGIATQTRVEQFLRGKGFRRAEMNRNDFNSHVLQWKTQYQTDITSQLKRMGFSLDWKREVFTLDPIQSEAVVEAFVRLFDEGLIYRADHLVNWCCFLRSTISDIEVNNIEIAGVTNVSVPGYDFPVKFGQMIYFAYKISGSPNEIVVATTRPETILGDVAIAVNINDTR
jgi:valyl-tRNA synthetase